MRVYKCRIGFLKTWLRCLLVVPVLLIAGTVALTVYFSRQAPIFRATAKIAAPETATQLDAALLRRVETRLQLSPDAVRAKLVDARARRFRDTSLIEILVDSPDRGFAGKFAQAWADSVPGGSVVEQAEVQSEPVWPKKMKGYVVSLVSEIYVGLFLSAALAGLIWICRKADVKFNPKGAAS